MLFIKYPVIYCIKQIQGLPKEKAKKNKNKKKGYPPKKCFIKQILLEKNHLLSCKIVSKIFQKLITYMFIIINFC